MVRTLRGAFASQLPQDARERTLAIAYKGAELADTALLAEADLLPTAERQIPHVYLCYGGTPAAPTPSVDSTPNNAPQNTLRRRRGEEMPDETHVVAQRERERERERAAPQPQPQRQPQERALPEAVDVNKCCRLCFDAEETLATGLLFSPCKCAGSMRYIHVSCLNTWRMRSQKESSYFECDQCRYKYNIVRTQWAGVVLHPHLAVAVAVVVLVLSTLLVGNLVHSTPLLESVHEKVWNFLQFYPIPFFATKYCQNDTCNTVCNTFDLWNWVERCRQAGCSCSMSPSVALSWFFAALTNGMVLVAMLGMYLNRHIILRNYFYAYVQKKSRQTFGNSAPFLLSMQCIRGNEVHSHSSFI